MCVCVYDFIWESAQVCESVRVCAQAGGGVETEFQADSGLSSGPDSELQLTTREIMA